MEIEIIETDCSRTKLTIAKDRATIKYPKTLEDTIRERQYNLALKAVSKLQTPDMVTRRGQFHSENEITMYIQSKKDKCIDPITFSEGN